MSRPEPSPGTITSRIRQDGERLRREDEARLAPLYAKSRRPGIQIVISDGLNANAVNDNLRQLLPQLKSMLGERGCHAGEVDIVVKNGRVRAGYQIGGLLDAELIIHLIGERPGTGLNTLSAYLTYGRDANGQSRWAPDMDHSKTSAICGIHMLAKRPSEAAGEIALCAARIIGKDVPVLTCPRMNRTRPNYCIATKPAGLRVAVSTLAIKSC